MGPRAASEHCSQGTSQVPRPRPDQMTAIGFRAEKDCLHWAVVSGTRSRPVLEARDRLRAPKTYSEDAALNWFRTQTENILTEHEPTTAAIRYAETFMKSSPTMKTLPSFFRRARIEGVIAELCASRGLPVSTGAAQQMASRLKAKSVRKYIESGDLRGIDLDSIKNASAKDAVVAACSALEGD